MPTLARDGVNIAYEITPGPAGATPLLLSHGYSASQAMWRPNLAALAADRTVITWDIRGHGRSDSPADPACYTHELTLGDMVALLDTCEVDVAAVGGLSLGGYLSLQFYAAHPERVRCLLLLDTGPGFRKDAARDGWNRFANSTADRLESEGAAALGRSPEVDHGANAQGLANAARGILAQRDAAVIDSLPAIAVPTLVLVGADDTNFLAASAHMANAIPGAEKVEIPAAGHAANIDQPEAFNAAVVAFLAKHAS